jgi:hypothetical protein
MPAGVEAPSFESGILEEGIPSSIQVARVDRCSDLRSEDEPAIRTCRSGRLLGELVVAVLLQRELCARHERKRATGLRALRCRLDVQAIALPLGAPGRMADTPDDARGRAPPMLLAVRLAARSMVGFGAGGGILADVLPSPPLQRLRHRQRAGAEVDARPWQGEHLSLAETEHTAAPRACRERRLYGPKAHVRGRLNPQAPGS